MFVVSVVVVVGVVVVCVVCVFVMCFVSDVGGVVVVDFGRSVCVVVVGVVLVG